MQVVTSPCVPTAPHDRVQLDERLPRRDEPWRGDAIVRVASAGDPASRLSVEQALGRALEEVARLKARLAGEQDRHRDVLNATGVDDIVGRTPSVLRLLDQVDQVAGTNSAVLVTGETGTGKELVARAVHRRSRRRDKPLVIVNCGALTPSLVESELFGHERGAFTGATSRRVGRFELAHRGTIFLDEVGELPEEIQVKLLRVLQMGEVERLGSTETLRVDVRLIAATNRNLEEAVAAGRFRLRSLLPAPRVPDPRAAAAGAAGGHSTPRRVPGRAEGQGRRQDHRLHP